MSIRELWCVNDWPETGQDDFKVINIPEGVSDAEAIRDGKLAYSEDHVFYVKEIK